MKPDALSPAAGAEPITDLLLQIRVGDRAAMDRLFPRVYDRLRHMAHQALRREHPDHTLGTTGLIHEAYLKLVDQTRAAVECRFFGGLTEEEIAEALGVTARTVKRDWAKARGRLYQELTA